MPDSTCAGYTWMIRVDRTPTMLSGSPSLSAAVVEISECVVRYYLQREATV